MSSKLADNCDELLGSLIRQLEKLQNRTCTYGEKVYMLNRQIADINAQILVITQLHKNGILNNAEYAEQSSELDRKVTELRSERRRIMAEDEDDEIIGYKFINFGKMMDFIKAGDDANTAFEKASGQYGRVADAVKIVDPRKE